MRRARELGVHYLDLAAEEMARFDASMQSIGLLPVYSEPRATSAIADILSLIGAVLDARHAYVSNGAVYFDVSSFAPFGQVSHLSRPEMLELAAERGGKPDDPNKRDPLDFVLWQPSAPDEPAWQSRWGPGRPGWHIECSALAMRELGETVDLHGGGRDLIFPHHECEAAQSESVTGTTFCRHWFHVGMVGLGGTKMSKSLGNLVFVGDLLKDWEPMAIRLALLEHHYRSDWEWQEAALVRATERLERWRAAGDGAGESRTSDVDSTPISTHRARRRSSTPSPPRGRVCRRGPPSWALACDLRLIAEVCARRHDHRGIHDARRSHGPTARHLHQGTTGRIDRP